GDVKAGLEPEAGTHRWQVWIAERAGLVTRRPEVAAVALRDGEADCVADVPGLDLVQPEQAREDRQPGRVGRGPAGRAERVGAEVEDGARPGRAGAVGVGGEGLVELAGVLV